MFPIYFLEWFFEGRWRRIGWTATNPESYRSLQHHGKALAESKPGDKYRIITPSLISGEEHKVVHEYEVEPPIAPELCEEATVIGDLKILCGKFKNHRGRACQSMILGRDGASHVQIRWVAPKNRNRI